MRPQQEFVTWMPAVQQLPIIDGVYLISGPSGFWGAAFSTETQTWTGFVGLSPTPPGVIAWANLPKGYR